MEMLHSFVQALLKPLTSNIKIEILLSCLHTFFIKVVGRRYENIKRIRLG